MHPTFTGRVESRILQNKEISIVRGNMQVATMGLIDGLS